MTTKWQDIASAPKGHHDVLDLWCIGLYEDIAFYCPDFCALGQRDPEGNHLYQGRVCNVWWRNNAWRPKCGLLRQPLAVTPTHWMRIPKSPSMAVVNDHYS